MRSAGHNGIAVAATIASLATPSIIANTLGLFTLAWLVSLAIPIGTTVLLVALSVRWLKKTSFERVRDEPAEVKLTLRERFLQEVSQRPRSVYPDGRNPVFVREFGDALHRAQINRGSLLATVVSGLVLFVVTFVMVQSGGMVQGAWGVENAAENLQWYFVTTIIAAATIPGISTPAWTNDRNSEMEEALDLTLLTRRERFIGRACAAAALPFIVTALGLWFWAGAGERHEIRKRCGGRIDRRRGVGGDALQFARAGQTHRAHAIEHARGGGARAPDCRCVHWPSVHGNAALQRRCDARPTRHDRD